MDIRANFTKSLELPHVETIVKKPKKRSGSEARPKVEVPFTLAYCPVRTYLDPSKRIFRNRKGEPTSLVSLDDADPLYEMGLDAWRALGITDEAQYHQEVAAFKGLVKELVIEMSQLLRDVPFNDAEGRRLTPEHCFAGWPASADLRAVLDLFNGMKKHSPMGKLVPALPREFARCFYMAALQEIDHALVGAFVDGRGAASAAIDAAQALATARELDGSSEAHGEARSRTASDAAKARYRNDKKQAAKREVFQFYQMWQANPDLYRGKSDFARVMQDKYPELESHVVIMRWVRKWRKQGPMASC